MTKTPRYGHAPIDMRRVENWDAMERVGDFYWKTNDGKRAIWIAIPCPNSRPKDGAIMVWCCSKWTIDHKNDCLAQWGWDGNEDQPTLTPSLHAIGVWHGWVRNGKLIEA